MSLWTPGGEHEVPREQPGGAAAPAEAGGQDVPDVFAGLSPEERQQLESMSPEERAQAEAMIREMAEVQQQMAQAPAAVVVANHAMGLYELATIHLRQQPPNFPEAQVAIDGFAALVDTLRGRLGADEATLDQALDQIRLAFVQLKNAVDAPGGGE